MESEEYVGSEPTCSLLNTKSPVDVRKGDCILLKDNPCKICSIAVFKTGKHGEAKYHFGGIDVFTGKRCEELYMAHKKVSCPEIHRVQLNVVNTERDGYITLMDEKTLAIRENVRVNDDEIRKNIYSEFEKGKEVTVTVLTVADVEKIIEYRSK